MTDIVMPEELTPARITEILSGQRERGGYKRILTSFYEGGELAQVVTDLPLYAAKNKQGVANSLNTNIKEHGFTDKVGVVYDKTSENENEHRVFIFNKVQYAAQLAAADAE